jgi:hypothetical protein
MKTMYDLQIFILILSSVVIIFFAFLISWYLIRNIRIKEKSILFGKDVDINKLNTLIEKKVQFPWLRFGIVVTGIAIGTLLVTLLTHSQAANRFYNAPGFSIGIIVLFAGLSMILANFIGRSKSQ